MRFAFRCDVGVVRPVNQDCVFCSALPVGPLKNLYIVADGMGGHKAGEIASQTAIDCFVAWICESECHPGLSVEERLLGALAAANRGVNDLSQTDEKYAGMGTTLVAVTIDEDRAWAINVGDSHLYKKEKNCLQAMTRDHSLVADLIYLGEITAEEAKTHPHRNIITRAVGIDQEVAGDVYQFPLQETEKVLLCSDGLYGMVDDQEIHRILEETKDLEEAAEKLLVAAKEAGGRDNISIILIECGGKEDAE